MDIALKLPIGIEDFREIRRQGFYYIDKTKLIEQLLDNWGKVNLFTRPRRFGKTLNMSMLRLGRRPDRKGSRARLSCARHRRCEAFRVDRGAQPRHGANRRGALLHRKMRVAPPCNAA